jgi:hypothetical protein
MKYRKLSKSEISELKDQNCFSENWNNINVSENFDTNKIKNSQFSGIVYLNKFDKNIKTNTGILKSTGIYNSFVHNCSIGANTLINSVKNIVNYKIGENVIIENVNNLSVEGSSSFGNGTEIEILNEGGGRELKIFDKLSSQIAYLIVTRRNRTKFIKNINSMIDKYVESLTSEEGLIENNSTIINCNYIKNVKFGEYSNIIGAMHLENGTIVSKRVAPVTIGEGVIAKSFIILSGSKVDGAALLDKTFIGQGVKIGKQYSAENSAFFANCEGFHGEACSIFAGPYTVTHHKSTLLIAGMFSFYNAGSGSNQSNHLYKLGPVHQGILERGAKTGSFSYMMWPSRVGAFTGVIGKHYSNFDSTIFPFSYILESGGKSVLMPAMNLCTVGTKRDSAKWPKRDRRTDSNKIDLINFQLFSPYIISKMMKGLEKLRELANTNEEIIQFEDLFLKKSKLLEAIEKYNMVIDIFIGDQIIERLLDTATEDRFESLLKKVTFDIAVEDKIKKLDNWNDIAGMLTPASIIDNFIDKIENSLFKNLNECNDELNNIYKKSESWFYSWCIELVENIYEKSLNQFTSNDIIQLIKNWRDKKIAFNKLILEDAKKEFSKKIQIGFGIDGDEEITKSDFEEVRGTFDNNSFVKEIKSESEQINKTANDLLKKLGNSN